MGKTVRVKDQAEWLTAGIAEIGRALERGKPLEVDPQGGLLQYTGSTNAFMIKYACGDVRDPSVQAVCRYKELRKPPRTLRLVSSLLTIPDHQEPWGPDYVPFQTNSLCTIALHKAVLDMVQRVPYDPDLFKRSTSDQTLVGILRDCL